MKRTHHLSLRLSEEDRELARAAAHRRRLSVSELCRQLLRECDDGDALAEWRAVRGEPTSTTSMIPRCVAVSYERQTSLVGDGAAECGR